MSVLSPLRALREESDAIRGFLYQALWPNVRSGLRVQVKGSEPPVPAA